MWKMIKKIKMPIVAKLTIIYSGVMLAVLVVVGAITYNALNWYIKDNARQSVQLSKAAVEEYLNSGGKVDKNMLSEVLLQHGISLRVYDKDKKLLFVGKADEIDSTFSQVALATAKYVMPKEAEFEKLEKMKKFKNDGRYYIEELEWQKGIDEYRFIFIKSRLTENVLLKMLLVCMSIAAAIGLMVATMIGYYMSRKILQPIRQLTLLSKNIDIHRLEERINVKGIADELHELAENFNQMLNRVHEGNFRQQQFVADASHELRTPLTVISGYAEMISNWGKNDPVVLDEGLLAIKEEAGQMKELIDKLLLLTKSDQGQLAIKKEPLQLAILFAELLKETEIYGQGQYHYQVEAEEQIEVLGDYHMLKQALRVLLDNSRKYSQPNSVITLHAHAGEKSLIISVIDEGCGIKEEDLPHVFERFYRADKARNSETGGSGLGLAIAKEIVSQHGGKVSIESKLGYGTKVSLYLPVQN